MGILTGTSGNDAIVAHTATDYQKGQLVLVMGGIPAGGEWPRPAILINGQWTTAVTIDAPVVQGQTETVTIQLPNVPITSIGIQYWNDGSIGSEDRNLYVGSVTLNGVNLPLNQATYSMDGAGSIPGQSDVYRNGTMTWSGTAVANAMAQPTSAENNSIDGGAGLDTVVYTGRENGNYEFMYQADASMTVRSFWNGFTDTLRGVENVLFDDTAAYTGGGVGTANVNAAGRTIDGGAGLDTLVLFGHRDQYYIQHTTTGFTIYGNGVDEWITNVERIQLTNGFLALDIKGNAGQAYRLYQAAFDRTPDTAGLGYQTHQLDLGYSLAQVANAFIASPEFQSKYGNVDDRQFVTLLYNNVLDRAPDQGGLEYHMNDLAHGVTRAQILSNFSESPENQANVIGSIQDGMFFTL
jgi:serralysin